MTTIDRTQASDEEFQARIAPFEAAGDDENGAVERVARAIWDATSGEGSGLAWGDRRLSDLYRNRHRGYARAAVAAMAGADTGAAAAARAEALAAGADNAGEGCKHHWVQARTNGCEWLECRHCRERRYPLDEVAREFGVHLSDDRHADEHVGSCRIFSAERRCTCVGTVR